VIVRRRPVRVEQEIDSRLRRAVEIDAAAAYFREALDSRFHGNDRTYRTGRRIAT
jgi:hypothetical protein